MLYFFLFLLFVFINYKLVVLVATKPYIIKHFDFKLNRFLNGNLRKSGVYTFFYKYVPVRKNVVFIESHLGKKIGDNPYYIMQEILSNHNYKDLKVVVVGDKSKYFQKKNIDIINKRVKFVKYLSVKYFYTLASAEYLVNDVTFGSFFIKKEQQKYLNTWHGTPLKAMGRHIEYSPVFLANTQRNFIHADCLLAPNQHVANMYKNDYMLSGLMDKKILISGYPRNTVFFNRSSSIKEALSISDKEVICYMPTWRGGSDKLKLQADQDFVQSLLTYFSNNLLENQLLYINLHPLTKGSVSVDEYSNIRFFPEEYETYEFLNEADLLITDYSSVFFDFANTRKKIVLYSYDYDEYTEERGFSLDYHRHIPFKKVDTREALLNEIVNVDKFIVSKEYDNFVETYCTYDSVDSTKKLCEYFFNNDDSNIKIENTQKSKSLNLIYTGQFLKNGITTSFCNLISNIDLDKHHFVCNFRAAGVKAKDYNTIASLDSRISYLPLIGGMSLTPIEKVSLYIFEKFHMNTVWSNQILTKLYKREVQRIYGDLKFDNIIHFTGYDKKPAVLYQLLEGHKTIFVHNDMKKELQTRNNFNASSIFKAWKNFDNVAVVRESLISVCSELVPEVKNKIHTVHNSINMHNHQTLMLNDISEEVKDQDILDDIYNLNLKKIVTVGRFSPEKGHLRLIDAFEKIFEKNPNVALFIVGGHGVLYEKTLEKVRLSIASKRIHVISSITNPYALLKHMNGFILSSYYEGLPMVFFEALLMDLPIVCTNISGPAEFLEQGYGTLVENNSKGLIEGLSMLVDGTAAHSKLDLNDFNNNSLKEFMQLMK